MTDPNANDDPDLQRHMDEVALLQAMYPEDEFVIEPSAVGLTVDITLGGTPVPVELRVLVPRGYPERVAPVLSLSCPRSSRRVQEELHLGLQSIVHRRSDRGDEILDEIMGDVRTLLAESNLDDIESQHPHQYDSPAHERPIGEDHAILVVVLWFHHLLSTTKRSDIVSLSMTHRLSGVCKPGYPGCLIVEGTSADVRAYVAELRSWRWQGFQTRSETALEQGRKMSRAWTDAVAAHTWKGVIEVEKMAEVVQALQPFDLDQLFLHAMKLGVSS